MPDYKQKRHAKVQQRQAATQAAAAAPRKRQQPQRKTPSHLHSIAKAAGYTVVAATDGWEADDIIGALCAVADAAATAGASRRPHSLIGLSLCFAKSL